MDTAKWPQEFVVKPMNEIVTNTTTTTTTTTCLKQPNPPPPTPSTVVDTTSTRKARPEKDQALNCPRCNSLNTKFCYYNNYSLTQPRYFCKDCRRYWTEGGSLRNIPIGGGVRKTKRSSSNSSSPSSNSNSSKKPVYNPPPPSVIPQQPNPKIGDVAKVQDLGFSTQGGFGNNNVKDLNLAFSSQGFGVGHHQSIPEFMQVLPSSMKHNNNNPLVSTSSALELLGISSNNSSNNPRPPLTSPFMPFPILQDSSLNYGSGGRDMGFGMSYPQFQEFMRPTAAIGFSLDGGMYGGDHHHNNPLHQEEGSTTTNGRPLLPFESLKLPVSSTSTNSGGNGNDNNHHQNQNQSEEQEKEKEDGEQSVGYWSGMLSGASSSAGTGTGTASWQ